MSTVNRADILKPSVSERILLVEDIWDSIAEAPDAIALKKAQELEFDARLDAYHKNPTRNPQGQSCGSACGLAVSRRPCRASRKP